MTEQAPVVPPQEEVVRVLNPVEDVPPLQNAAQNAAQNPPEGADRNAAVQDGAQNPAQDAADPDVQEAAPQVELGLDQVLRRIKVLEDSQKATVDSLLEEIRHFVKSPVFTKDKALDLLLDLKLVARETKHTMKGFSEACLQTMREKATVPLDQFKKYIDVVLGDKDQEKVMEMIAKVDKASKASHPGTSRPCPYVRNTPGRSGRANVQCYWCHRHGHYQGACPERRNQARRAPRANASRENR